MGEKNKFIIIDEKPKRRPPRRAWRNIFVILGVMVILLCGIYVGLCFWMTDCGTSYSTGPFYLTMKAIVRQNATTEAQLTLTSAP